MVYISIGFYFFVLCTVILYYLFPMKYRWIVLLLGSVGFYYKVCGKGIIVLLFTAVFTYIIGRLLCKKKKRWILLIGVLLTIVPWLLFKFGLAVTTRISYDFNWVEPLGISFYSLQIIAYLTDIYRDEILPEENFAKYLLYIMFFPQIVQGPIPRYRKLAEDLFKGHKFNEKNVIVGFQKILWGFFLKLMIADKAAIIVNAVFDNSSIYGGFYILIAAILYSIQLYTDFSACVYISKGISMLYGVHLPENFLHPYFAVSIKDFWRRWHISLSTWLRDYIYIPLGGNRKGIKAVNILITFIVSGFWHGNGMKYIMWGMLHGIYQIIGEYTKSIRKRIYKIIGISEYSNIKLVISQIGTFFWVTVAWILFRASSLKKGIQMIYSMFTVFNPEILFNDSLLTLGLDWKEWGVLIVAVIILYLVSKKQERESAGYNIADKPLIIRWGIYIVTIISIIVFGTYGFGYNVQDFIYGGF